MAHGHGHFGHMKSEGPETGERRWGIFRADTFAALKHRDYRYHWLSHSVGGMASWVQTVTLALLVNEITDSSFWVGTVLGIRALPILLIGPLAGVAIDRFDRKKLLMATQLALAVMAFLFAWGVHQGEVNKWYALLFSFFLGLDLSINGPVRQSLVANVVPRVDLPNAIALENSVGTLVRAIAPLLGVALITPIGYSGNFFVQSAAYLLMFLVLIPMRTPYREGFAEGDSVMGNFMEGIRHIRSDVTLLLLIVLIIIPSIFVHSTQNLLVIFADDILQGDEELVLGLLLLSFGVGALIATFIMASLARFQRRGLINMGAILLVTLFLTFFGLSSHLVLSLLLIGFMGLFNAGFNIANNTLVQTRIPDALRGRITSIYLIDHGVQPLGSALLGLVALPWILGPGYAVAVAGLLAFVVTAFIALRWRELWRLQ